MTSCLQYQSNDTKFNADKICRNVNELDIPWLSKYNVLHSSLSQITLLGKLSRVPFCLLKQYYCTNTYCFAFTTKEFP